MNQLIKITQHQDQQAVSARDLHGFLESKRDFTTWMKDRVVKYELEENVDFTLHKFVERKTWKHEYILTIDTAKELAMVEGNEKGKQARRYFIECEKKYKELKAKPRVLSDNSQELLSIAMDVVKISDDDVRMSIMQKLMALQNKSSQTEIRERNPEYATNYTDTCIALVQQAVDFEYQNYLPSFMNNQNLATAAAIVDGSLRCLEINDIAFGKSAFFRALGQVIEAKGIKHLPRTYRPLRDKIRDYANGQTLIQLIKYKNVGNQNARKTT